MELALQAVAHPISSAIQMQRYALLVYAKQAVELSDFSVNQMLKSALLVYAKQAVVWLV